MDDSTNKVAGGNAAWRNAEKLLAAAYYTAGLLYYVVMLLGRGPAH